MVKQEVQKVFARYGVRKEHPVLVALSGGADSMALLHVFMESGYKCQAAHCNFHLRDEESDEDEKFVVNYCLGRNIPLHVRHFYTKEEAAKRGVSVEMAARELRYSWFWELMDKENFYWLATGHHGDDMIETFFLNLARGTGLRGLKGMQFRSGQLIRPMLTLRRTQIEQYCYEQGIPFRTDSSNTDTAFQRNNIRHNVLPVMNLLNPSFFNTMMHNFRNLEEAWQIVEKEVISVRKEIVAEEGDQMMIPIRLIEKHPQRSTILFELLRPYGFNSQTVSEIIDSFETIPGKQFFSANYRLVRDRFNLVVVPIREFKDELFYIDSEEKEILSPVHLKIRQFERKNDFRISRLPDCVHLDADHIDFPLVIRHWHKGDQFRPLGMETFKKLSDFFVDEKLSLVEKERTWLLLSGDDIVWVIGQRIDDRFKVTSNTKNILEIKALNSVKERE
jgi:tRNA(Ile)-lysidine synthase